MPNVSNHNDYAQMVSLELEAAARESTRERKRAHLDKAAVFAALDEERRRSQPDEGVVPAP